MADSPLPVLRAAFERTGSPAWLMQLIQQQALDRQNGFSLQIDYGDDQWHNGQHATEARLLAGAVDFIDCDWLTLLRCRREGAPIKAAHPYGQILGGLMLRPGLSIRSLNDLSGCRLGVVNQRDKNWQLLCHYALNEQRFDLARQITLVETGSKTQLANQLAHGAIDAALVYWHLIPGLGQQGCQLLLEIPDLLGDACGSATTFFLFHEDLLNRQPQLVAAFIRAFEQAKTLLAVDDARWQPIGAARQLNNEQTQQLRKFWQRRIALPWQMAAADQLWPLTMTMADYRLKEFTAAFWHRAESRVPLPA